MVKCEVTRLGPQEFNPTPPPSCHDSDLTLLPSCTLMPSPQAPFTSLALGHIKLVVVPALT